MRVDGDSFPMTAAPSGRSPMSVCFPPEISCITQRPCRKTGQRRLSSFIRNLEFSDAYVRLRQARGKTEGKAEANPPYVLNWYANPMGEGGYAESACIPFADDGDAWTAVFGTFVAFAPGTRAKVPYIKRPT